MTDQDLQSRIKVATNDCLHAGCLRAKQVIHELDEALAASRKEVDELELAKGSILNALAESQKLSDVLGSALGGVNRLNDQQSAEIARLSALLPVWIPVSERLPKPRQLVWCHANNEMGEEHQAALRWNGSCWLNKWGAEIIDNVTHWQPLPAPPQAPQAQAVQAPVDRECVCGRGNDSALLNGHDYMQTPVRPGCIHCDHPGACHSTPKGETQTPAQGCEP